MCLLYDCRKSKTGVVVVFSPDFIHLDKYKNPAKILLHVVNSEVTSRSCLDAVIQSTGIQAQMSFPDIVDREETSHSRSYAIVQSAEIPADITSDVVDREVVSLSGSYGGAVIKSADIPASRSGSYDDTVIQSAEIQAYISSPDMGCYTEQCDVGRKPESLSQIMLKRQLEKIRARNLSLDSDPSDVDYDDDKDEDFVPNSTDEATSDLIVILTLRNIHHSHMLCIRRYSRASVTVFVMASVILHLRVRPIRSREIMFMKL